MRRDWDLLALNFDPTPGVVPYVELASDPGKAFGEPEPLIGELIQEECSAGLRTVPTPQGSFGPIELGPGPRVAPGAAGVQ